jgi:hypothetical protein
MGKRRRFRRVLAAIILVLILLGAGWTGLWFIIAGRLEDHLASWEQQQRAAGWVISHGAPSRTGWPMAAGITLPDIAITGAEGAIPGGLAWSAGALTLALDIRHPNDLFLAVAGKQQLRIMGSEPIPLQATKLIGRVTLLPGGRPGLIQLHATGVLAALDDGTPGGAVPLTIGDVAAALRVDVGAQAGWDAVAAAVTATAIGLPPRFARALGPTVQTLAFDAALSGPVPDAAEAAATAKAWRDAGGTFSLRLLHLLYGPLNIDGAGSFQLDATLRPAGSVTIHATGLAPSLDRLAVARDIPHSVAVAVKAMLGLLVTPPGASTGVLDARLILRDGLISLGVVPLLRLSGH